MKNKALLFSAGIAVLAYTWAKRKGLSGLGDDYDYVDIGPAPTVPIDANAYWASRGQQYNALAYGYGSVSNPYNPYNYWPYNQQSQYGQYPGYGQTYNPYGYNSTYTGIYGTGTTLPAMGCTGIPYPSVMCPMGQTYSCLNNSWQCSPIPGYVPTTCPAGTYQMIGPGGTNYCQSSSTPFASPTGYPTTYPTTYPYTQPQYPVAYGQAGAQYQQYGYNQQCALVPLVGNRCYPGYVRYQGMCRPRSCPVSYYR